MLIRETTVIPKQEDEIMFIKFDELDMLDFFENEPISIGEGGEAKFIYSIKDSHQFSMTYKSRRSQSFRWMGTGGGTQYDLIGQRIDDFKNERILEGN